MGFGSKMGIDATRKWRSAGFEREWPRCHRDGRENQEVHRLDLGETRDMTEAAVQTFNKFSSFKPVERIEQHERFCVKILDKKP
jgi:hypothetical protein